MDETMQLGGNIELSGFGEVDRSSMIIVKKVVGSFAKKLSGTHGEFEKLSVIMKTVHQDNHQLEFNVTGKFELHARILQNGKQFSSEVTERNLFVTLDKVLKKLEHAATH